MPSFGKFPSFSKFLDSLEADRQRANEAAEAGLSLEARRSRRRQPARNVVEVSAVVLVHEPDDTDGDRHLRMKVRISEVVETDPDVDADLQRCFTTGDAVFVAVRIGDRMGILNPPVDGLNEGSALHLRGEWIPLESAQAHGGERMSVLHFTHHPIGFICTETPEEKCFS
jgi:endonuclease G